jgi:hypothetical protein
MTIITRDELAAKLKAAFEKDLCHLDNWVPLADHVIDLMELTQRKVLEVKWEEGTMNPVIIENEC